MKAIYLAIFLLIGCVVYSQFKASKDGWIRIYYLTDENGFEVAKRFDGDSVWVISDPAKSLERMYLEKQEAETKYALALEILKQLNPNGTPKDMRAYNLAITNYNKYLQKK